MVRLAGASAFQWSETEQVYPLEKAKDGSTLYCKEILVGDLPASGYIAANHGVSELSDITKLFKLEGWSHGNGYPTVINVYRQISDHDCMLYLLNDGRVIVSVNQDYRGYRAYARLIYKK